MGKRNNKVLVSGTKGFIGKHLFRRLSEMGIIVVTNGGKKANHDTNLDVTDMNNLHSIEKGVETIIHLAGKSSVPDSFARPYKTYYNNILGTLNLLEFAKQRNIRKFIFTSTYVYGQPKYLPIDEGHPVNPNSPYHVSKLITEQICESYSNEFGINIVTLRPFYIYGPGSRPYSFISSAIRQINRNEKVLLSGEQTKRDFLFIDDFINLVEAILKEFPAGYNMFNVGYGRSYTLKEVSSILAKLLNKKITIHYDNEMRPGDIVRMTADISKVSSAFNWKPSTSLKKGLELTIRNTG